MLYRHVESIGEYILEQSISVRAVPELIVGEDRSAVEFFVKFGKASYRFAYEWPDSLETYKYANLDRNIPCDSRVMSFFTH